MKLNISGPPIHFAQPKQENRPGLALGIHPAGQQGLSMVKWDGLAGQWTKAQNGSAVGIARQ